MKQIGNPAKGKREFEPKETTGEKTLSTPLRAPTRTRTLRSSCRAPDSRKDPMEDTQAPIQIDSDEECKKKKRSRIVTRQVTRMLESPIDILPSFYDSLPPNRSSKRLAGSKRDKPTQHKLDTNIFESYMEDLWNRIAEDKRSSYTYFDSLWFSMYYNGHEKSKILQWIKHKQIFSRQYVFVPIVCWSHWSLLILCHFGETDCSHNKRPCMLLLDSLKTTGPKRLEADIRRFIADIYKSEGREENKRYINKIPLLVPDVPQQTDGEECGIFVLYFIYCFLQKSPEDFAQVGEDFSQQFGESWFDPEELENFRKKVHLYQISRNTENVE